MNTRRSTSSMNGSTNQSKNDEEQQATNVISSLFSTSSSSSSSTSSSSTYSSSSLKQQQSKQQSKQQHRPAPQSSLSSSMQQTLLYIPIIDNINTNTTTNIISISSTLSSKESSEESSTADDIHNNVNSVLMPTTSQSDNNNKNEKVMKIISNHQCVPLYLPTILTNGATTGTDNNNRGNKMKKKKDYSSFYDALLYENTFLLSRAQHALFHNSNDDHNNNDQYLSLPSLSQKGQSQSQHVVIYAHQREVVHASNLQYKQYYTKNNNNGILLASDDATTCHILALRSYKLSSVDNDNNKEEKQKKILGSLCHLDSTKLKPCIELMFQHHFNFHNIITTDINTTNNNNNNNNNNKFIMEIHIIGGYNDSNFTSIELSNHLLYLLNDISHHYYNVMDCILQTCIISPLNDISSYTYFCNNGCKNNYNNNIASSFSSPMVRGLAMNINTGSIQLLQKVDKVLRGPELTLRRCRIYQHHSNTLLEIHSYNKTTISNNNLNNNNNNERIYIKPFHFESFENIDKLYQLPNDILLKVGSTSPDVEDDDFCDVIRETFHYLMNVDVDSVFEWRKKKEKVVQEVVVANNMDDEKNSMNDGLFLSYYYERKPLIFEYSDNNCWNRVD